MIPVITAAFEGLYNGGVAYLLDYSKTDKKIFDFATPKGTHAVAFGVLSSLAYCFGEIFVRNMTNTQVSRNGFCSDNIHAYRHGCFAARILALIGTAYALNQMHYRIPYRFIPISLIPNALVYLYQNS